MDTAWMKFDLRRQQVLGRDACLGLLGGPTLGRIALSVRALPTILPVPYHFDGQHILVGTSHDSTVLRAAAGSIVAFETGRFDARPEDWWTVSVTGPARLTEEPAHIAALGRSPAAQWLSEPFAVLAVEPTVVSGCRLAPPGP